MYLPLFGWIGVVAALFFAGAITVAKTKILPPKKKFKVHKGLATTGAILATIHIVLALNRYMPITSTTISNPENDIFTMAKVTEAISIDGDTRGYPNEGIETGGVFVNLAHDGNNMYIYIEAETSGWLSVGFNELGKGMDSAIIMMGYIDEDGKAVFSEEVARGYTHGPLAEELATDFIINENLDKLVIELAYPMKLPTIDNANIKEFIPGESYSLLTAYSSSAKNLTTIHSSTSMLEFTIEQ